MALIGSLNNPSIKRVISIVGLDLGEYARSIRKNKNLRQQFKNMLDQTMSDSGMTRGAGGKAIVEEMLSANMDRFDNVKHAKELANKDILLLGGWQDRQTPLENYILPLYRALQKNGAENLEIEMFNDNHYFMDPKERERLTITIISWIKRKAGDKK